MNIRIRVILIFIILASFIRSHAGQEADWVDWLQSGRLPVAKGLSGVIAGVSNGVMVVAGGSIFT
ncbi:MAG: hypothetical protein QM640_06255 [Niabella sp.]